MQVLFTKRNLDKKIISRALGEMARYDLIDVIRTTSLKVKPFPLKDYSLIFTSVNGVEAFFENGFKANESFKSANYNRIYTVGPKTKNALKKRQFGTFKVLRHAQELQEFIIEHASGEKFLHFCGNLSLDVLDPDLPLQNIQYRKIPLYVTTLLYPKVESEHDAIVFFSPSGVRSYIEHNSIENKLLFSIGHTTEKEIRKYTNSPVYSSEESHLSDLLQVIKKVLSRKLN